MFSRQSLYTVCENSLFRSDEVGVLDYEVSLFALHCLNRTNPPKLLDRDHRSTMHLELYIRVVSFNKRA